MAYGENMPRLSPCPNALILALAEEYCPAPKAVLDIGCGRGDRLRAFGAAFPQARLAGVDADEDMVKLSSAVGDVRLGHAEALPFEDEDFDIILCECSLSLFADGQKSLFEAAGLLEKGGVLILGEVIAPIEEDSLECPDGEAMKRIYSPAAIEKMAEKAGLSLLKFLDRREDLAAMAAQMIFDGSFCQCLGENTARMLMKLKAGYGLWIFEKG